MNTLVIEDDLQLNTTITNFLKYKKYQVSSCDDGQDAIDLIDKNEYDFYIIDVNIPSISGLDLVKYIRSKDLDTPILMITASLELSNFKIAFENGCNEYIKKPFYLEELEIRMNNLLNIIDNENDILQISNNITYNKNLQELKIDKEIKHLRKKEKRLLHILLENVNKTVSTEVLENYVWENQIKDYYPLRQLVNELRKHFDTEEKFIYTSIGNGYKFEIKNKEN